MRAATSTTYILPDLPWTALLPAITQDARAGDHIVVHTDAMYAAVMQALRVETQAEMDGLNQQIWRASEAGDTEYRKQERYCKEQREVLRALEELAAHAPQMYELDDAKDQVMSVCKVALANLVLWTRDQYFPAAYAHATWQRLEPFFKLSGRVRWGPERVEVEFRQFTDRQLNRDLAALCARVGVAKPRLPDGRQLIFMTGGSSSLRSDDHR